MTTLKWQDHFKTELGDLETNFDAAQSGKSLLGHVLSQQIITTENYFAWVQEHFGLPVLKLSYFSDNPANQKIWQHWKNSYAWSAECVPLRQWEDILYVACLEPQSFPENMKVVCVLTPPAGLQQLWTGYQSEDLFELKEEDKAKDAALDLNKLEMSAQAPAENQEINLELSDEESSEEASDSDSESEQMPEGMGPMETGKLEKTTLFAKTPGSPLAKTENLAPAAPTPEEVSPEPSPAPAVAQENTPAAVLNPVSAKPNESSLLSALSPVSPKEVKAVPVVRPLAKDDLASLGSVEGKYFLADIFKGNEEIWKKEAHAIFDQMKPHFEKSLLLSIDAKGLQAQVLSWSEEFKPTDKTSPVDLSKASIFRIAASTQKPFHGPISLNDVNEKFFKEWNNTFTPHHATLVPLIIDGKAVGILLGFGEANAFTRNVLSHVENLAKDFTMKLVNPEGLKANVA